MVQFFQEIQEQPQALLQTANFYKSVEGKSAQLHKSVAI